MRLTRIGAGVIQIRIFQQPRLKDFPAGVWPKAMKFSIKDMEIMVHPCKYTQSRNQPGGWTSKVFSNIGPPDILSPA
jgi:hypothetical protein